MGGMGLERLDAHDNLSFGLIVTVLSKMMSFSYLRMNNTKTPMTKGADNSAPLVMSIFP